MARTVRLSPRADLLAQELFLGENLLPLLVLAVGAAMVVGPMMAYIRPRSETREGELARAPLGRTLVFMAIGMVAVIWSLATLFR